MNNFLSHWPIDIYANKSLRYDKKYFSLKYLYLEFSNNYKEEYALNVIKYIFL